MLFYSNAKSIAKSNANSNANPNSVCSILFKLFNSIPMPILNPIPVLLPLLLF